MRDERVEREAEYDRESKKGHGRVCEKVRSVGMCNGSSLSRRKPVEAVWRLVHWRRRHRWVRWWFPG
jgi:hypothetical protein